MLVREAELDEVGDQRAPIGDSIGDLTLGRDDDSVRERFLPSGEISVGALEAGPDDECSAGKVRRVCLRAYELRVGTLVRA